MSFRLGFDANLPERYSVAGASLRRRLELGTGPCEWRLRLYYGRLWNPATHSHKAK